MLRLDEGWAIGSDEYQFILYKRAKKEDAKTPWQARTFHSTLAQALEHWVEVTQLQEFETVSQIKEVRRLHNVLLGKVSKVADLMVEKWPLECLPKRVRGRREA